MAIFQRQNAQEERWRGYNDMLWYNGMRGSLTQLHTCHNPHNTDIGQVETQTVAFVKFVETLQQGLLTYFSPHTESRVQLKGAVK